MVAKDSAYLKSTRLKEIARIMAIQISRGKKISLNNFLDYLEYEFGLRRSTAQKYLELICKNHNWEMLQEKNVWIIRVIK